MDHDRYWTDVCERAHDNLNFLLKGGGTSVAEVLGDGNGIDSLDDAKRALSYAIEHGDSCDQATAIIAVCEIVTARHELAEHSAGLRRIRDVSAAGAAE